jgi:hypothetical protein
MSAIKIETNAPKTDRSLEVEYDFGDTCAEAIAKFGEEVVFSNFKQSVVISLQGLVRRYLEKKDDKHISDEDIITKVAAWKPGVAAARTGENIQEKALKAFATMSAEDKASFIEKLKQSMGV